MRRKSKEERTLKKMNIYFKKRMSKNREEMKQETVSSNQSMKKKNEQWIKGLSHSMNENDEFKKEEIR